MRRTALVALIALGCMLPLVAWAQTAPELSAQGKALLAKGDLDGALKAYQAAARADQDNAQYAQQFAIVRQAVELRRRLQTEQDPERWEFMASALHSFYVRNGMYPAALAVAGQMHQRLHTETSALVVAETAFALDNADLVVKTLSSLEPGHVSPVSRALLGVALSRLGKAQEARQIANTIRMPDDASPGAIYALARLQAATGDRKAALGSLERMLSAVPPSRQEAYKNHARQSPEFAAMASTPEFAKVLATESKVPESKCSGGSNCAGCPMRGKCSHSQQPQ